MQYLLDTVTIVRHFSAMGKIGEEAHKILNSFESSFIISVISLMEIMYLRVLSGGLKFECVTFKP